MRIVDLTHTMPPSVFIRAGWRLIVGRTWSYAYASTYVIHKGEIDYPSSSALIVPGTLTEDEEWISLPEALEKLRQIETASQKELSNA